MRVYHILPSQFAISDLALRRLKIALIDQLNDPFELLPYQFLNPEQKEAFERIKREHISNLGLISFSEDWRNPVLWSHYGDKHRGICLGFDIKESKHVQKVTYLKDRLVYDNLPSLEVAHNLMFSKYKDWHYEQEWRAYFELDHSTKENGMYFYEFGEILQLREIILGVSCETPTLHFKELLNSIGSKISLKKARLDNDYFLMAVDINTEWFSN